MNETLPPLLINVMTINLIISRGSRLIMYVNPKRYEVSEYIVTKVEVNPRIISTLKTKNPFES